MCLPFFKMNNTEEILKKFRIVIKGSGETFGIRKYIAHPNLNVTGANKIKNDIGIVKLDRNITFSRFVQPACLDFQTKNQYNSQLNIAGKFKIKLLKIYLNSLYHSLKSRLRSSKIYFAIWQFTTISL